MSGPPGTDGVGSSGTDECRVLPELTMSGPFETDAMGSLAYVGPNFSSACRERTLARA
jgi:hypothetical protein